MKLPKTFAILAITFFSFYSFTSADPSTTIVVIDGKALLVDLDARGKIVTTYMEVEGYFESTKDHESKVLDAKADYTRLSKAQMDQIRFISLADEGFKLDEFMVTNIADLATHYQQTYANQIEITAARNSTSNELVEANINKIKTLLVRHGVASHDIVVNYKIDMGEEPTRFVKVVSNLRSLASN